MNQYFAIDSKTDDYESNLASFEDGSLVFTLATTGAVADIRDKIKSGDSTISYGVATIPDSTGSLQSKTMSVTDCLVINGYSAHQDLAEDFVQYVLYQQMDGFTDSTGMPVAQNGITYSDSHMDGFTSAYEDSVPVTKLREASNFWMLLVQPRPERDDPDLRHGELPRGQDPQPREDRHHERPLLRCGQGIRRRDGKFKEHGACGGDRNRDRGDGLKKPCPYDTDQDHQGADGSLVVLALLPFLRRKAPAAASDRRMLHNCYDFIAISRPFR